MTSRTEKEERTKEKQELWVWGVGSGEWRIRTVMEGRKEEGLRNWDGKGECIYASQLIRSPFSSIHTPLHPTSSRRTKENQGNHRIGLVCIDRKMCT